MQIQLGTEESQIEHEAKPVEFSTPLKIEEINEFYDQQKSEFLKTQMKLIKLILNQQLKLLIQKMKCYLMKLLTQHQIKLLMMI